MRVFDTETALRPQHVTFFVLVALWKQSRGFSYERSAGLLATVFNQYSILTFSIRTQYPLTSPAIRTHPLAFQGRRLRNANFTAVFS